jgi:hypothetical protein
LFSLEDKNTKKHFLLQIFIWSPKQGGNAQIFYFSQFLARKPC